MKYDISELGDFLVVRVIGNMTVNDKPSVLIDAINDYLTDEKNKKFLFDLEKVDDIDDDGIDVFINCLSLQSEKIEDEDIIWAENLDKNAIEKDIAAKLSKQTQSEKTKTEDDDEEEAFSLADVYKESPNAPMTDCFILVKDDAVYDKLYDSGVSGLMTIYRTREDFTRDQGVTLSD